MSKYRVIPMQCGDNESYALLFYEADGAVMVDIHDSGTRALVQTLKTPFPVGGIATIRSIQSFDVMFFAQPETRPCKLSRKNKEGGAEGEYEFSFEDNEFLPEPVMDWNDGDEHRIEVFPFTAELKTSGSSSYYPEGSIRFKSSAGMFRLYFSHHEIFKVGTESGKYLYEVYVYLRCNSEKAPFFIEGLEVIFFGDENIYQDADYQISSITTDSLEAVSARDCRANAVELSENSYPGIKCAKFKTAKIESVSYDSTIFFLGSVVFRSTYTPSEIESGMTYLKSQHVSAHVTYNSPEFYIAIKDAPSGEPVSNQAYYRRSFADHLDVLMTIDGSNENENIKEGQIIALRNKSSFSESGVFSYEGSTGYVESAYPPVTTLDPLSYKVDYAGEQLRPASGGGYGLSSDVFPVRGKVSLRTEGKWSGVIELHEVDDKGRAETIAKIVSENGLSNTSLDRDVTEFGRSVRVACVRREYAYEVSKSINGDGGVHERVFKSDTGCQWILSSESYQISYLRIKGKTTVNKKKCYVAEVISGVDRMFSTNSYALGAWCKENGYPRHIGIYQERLVYAGNKTKPTTVWMSKTNSWDDFELGTEASSAITATLATDKYDEIKWLLPNKNGITIGTHYNEFSLGSNDGAVTTADNVMATITSNIGSSEIYADAFGTATIMVKTGRKELYRIDYNTLSEEAAGNQISLLASHLFENDPVVDMFSIKAPSNMLFCLHESGKLSSLTYEPDYGVNGWARHEILDGIDSGCVFRRGGKDVLALVVRDGDSYVLGELDLSADVWTDDGRSYESSAVTTPLVFDGNRGGYGKQTIISGCDVYVGEESKRFNVRLNGGDWVRVDRGFDEKNEPRAFEHMRVEIPANSGWVDEATVEIRSDAPYPLVVRAIGASGNG